MKSFFRAVRLISPYRWTLGGSIACCLGVALLWSANIGTVYPIIEVVFQNKSVPQWADEEVAELTAASRETSEQIKGYQDLLNGGSRLTSARRAELERQLAIAKTKLAAEKESLDWALQVQPVAHRYLPVTPFSTLVVVVILLITGTLLKDLLLVGNIVLVERLAQLATFDLRKQFYRNTLRLDLSTFGADHTAGLMARFTNDMSAVTRGISTLIGKTLREPLKMTVCLVGAGMICWRLLLLSLIMAPLAIYLVSRLAASIKRASRRAMEEMTQLYGVLSETFTGIKVVKAFTMERHERQRFHQTSKNYYRRAMRIAKYNSLIRPTTELMGISIICMAMLSGGYLVLNQQTHLFGIRMSVRPLGFGALITFYALLIGASDPLRKLADVFASLQTSAAAAERIYELLDREPAIRDVENPQPLVKAPQVLTFQNVDFHYTAGQPVIKQLNLTIRQGETIAIVGPNGCGKSTLANLIPRFYDPVAGSILIDGSEIQQYQLSDLRKTIGIVSQQTLLFDDTILNNIRYGSPEATEEEVVAVARQARAHQFISQQLPDGYQTTTGEGGSKLSGGQRQRIALARAILRDPEILILDEATSQIDTESEVLIHQALEKFTEGRTTIMITHRASSLQLADRVVVMEAGRLIDEGPTTDLLQRCGLFQRLFQQSLKESA
jgi:ATP-binding cassette subfamily B protein/subfamily B ATP-binding cassette protein MsbA